MEFTEDTDHEEYSRRHEMMADSWRTMSHMLRISMVADLIDATKLYNIVVPADMRLPFAEDDD